MTVVGPFSDWTGCDELQWIYKSRKTAPKLEFNKTPKLLPHMEMCSVFKLFPAFLNGNINRRVFIRNSIKSLKKKVHSVSWCPF